MDPRDWNIIQQNYAHLCNVLDIKDIRPHLIQEGLISGDDEERIFAETTKSDQVHRFLNILKMKGNNAYLTFLKILSKNHDFIREMLEKTIVNEDLLKGSDEQAKNVLKQRFYQKQTSTIYIWEVQNIIESELRGYPICTQNQTHLSSLVIEVFPDVKLDKERGIYNGLAKQTSVETREISSAENLKSNIGHPRDATNTALHSQCDNFLEKMTVEEVCQIIQPIIQKHNMSQEVLEIFKAEHMDGYAFKHLTHDAARVLLKGYSFGSTIVPLLQTRDEILQQKLQQNVVVTRDDSLKPKSPISTSTSQLASPYRETFRKFDRPSTSRDAYKKGAVLKASVRRCYDMLKPIHHVCCMPSVSRDVLHWICEETVMFGAACMNDRTNGTIHFGISDRSTESHRDREIVGLAVEINTCKKSLNIALKEAFCPDQVEIALKCIRDPQFMPVVDLTSSESESNPKYVIEIDVVPCSEIIEDEAIYIWCPRHYCESQKNMLVVYRCADGRPEQATGEEKIQFMKMKNRLTESRQRQEQTSTIQNKPYLRAQFLDLLTGGIESFDEDIYPLFLFGPLDSNMDDKYIAEHLGLIKDISPYAIFDFDPSSYSKGLFKFFENNDEQVYRALTTDNFDKNKPENRKNKDRLPSLLDDLRSSVLKPWIFCNGYDELDLKAFGVRQWKQERSEGYNKVLRFYQDQIPDGRARVIFWLFSKNYDVMLEAAEDIFVKFKEQWIVLAEDEAIINQWVSELSRRQSVDKKTLRERCVVGMPWGHINQTIKQIAKPIKTGACELVTSQGVHCHLKQKVQNELCDLDILSCNECDNMTISQNTELIENTRKEQEEMFFRGGQVTWWNFWFRDDHVLCREIHNDLMKQVERTLQGDINEHHIIGIVELYHQPGAGGTTSARQILWDLRKCTRCCVIKQITDQTCEQIARFRNYEDSNPKPPVIVIDNQDNEKITNLITSLQEKAQVDDRRNDESFKIFCLLLVCVKRASVQNLGRTNVAILKHELQPKEQAWFTKKNADLQRKFRNNDGVNPKLLISFNVLKENFNPDYIRRVAREFVEDINEDKEKVLLKYLSLINSFDIDLQSVPVSSFDMIMNDDTRNWRFGLVYPGSNSPNGWEIQISSSLKVLLNRTSKPGPRGELGGFKIISRVLAIAILNCLIEQTNTTISSLVTHFLEYMFKMKICSREPVLKIMMEMLKKRRMLEKGKREVFSPLIMEITEREGPDKTEDVLIKAFDMTEDPMLAQQIARFYIHTKNWEQASKYAHRATIMLPNNSFVWDTYGQVNRFQLIQKYSHCTQTNEIIMSEEAMEIIKICWDAIEKFCKAQECNEQEIGRSNNVGYFGELQVILLSLNILDYCTFSANFDIFHKFLVDPSFFHDNFNCLSEQTIFRIKRLQLEANRVIRILHEKQTQLTKDKSELFSQKSTRSDKEMLSCLEENLDRFLGEETDEVPKELSLKQACDFRRRRVKRLGGRSLNSMFDLRWNDDGRRKLNSIHKLGKANVSSNYVQVSDLVTAMNVVITMANCCPPRDVNFSEMLQMSQILFDKNEIDIEEHPHIEPFLYFVMFNWPTEGRKHIQLCSMKKIETAVSKWRATFDKIHSKPKSGAKTTDKTLFVLGKGTGMEEIVVQQDLRRENGNRDSGNRIWRSEHALGRLQRIQGTLNKDGNEVLVQIQSPKGNISSFAIPTSVSVYTKSMWQKRVYFVLGFCWSGPKAFDVTTNDPSSDKQMPIKGQRQALQHSDLPSPREIPGSIKEIGQQLEYLKAMGEKSKQDFEKIKKLERKREELLREQYDLLGGINL